MAHILVVDDSPTERLFISKVLEETGHKVSTADSGEEGIEAAKKTHPDLILMDIQLPGLDGIRATIEIRDRETEKTSKTPIFALVGSSSQADGEYLAADFDRCLIKPVSKDKLLEAITMLNIPDKKIVK